MGDDTNTNTNTPNTMTKDELKTRAEMAYETIMEDYEGKLTEKQLNFFLRKLALHLLLHAESSENFQPRLGLVFAVANLQDDIDSDERYPSNNV